MNSRRRRGAGSSCCAGKQRGGKRQQQGLGRLKKNINLLRVLSDKSQPRNLKTAIIKTAPPQLVASVADCCRNILNGKVALSPVRRKQLQIHKNVLRALAAPNISGDKKRRILVQQQQRGGFLPALLAAAIPVVIDIVARQLQK